MRRVHLWTVWRTRDGNHVVLASGSTLPEQHNFTRVVSAANYDYCDGYAAGLDAHRNAAPGQHSPHRDAVNCGAVCPEPPAPLCDLEPGHVGRHVGNRDDLGERVEW